ncbi:MAG: type II toxin-antitoxin system HipA family toxin [Clostridiales Family XIII bacterium]|jgi:serine/threonine-protein kinase HipA|nr:type II toxin-antitoxin system HipA family toxin [Clostridiales Family XIII bacterium]
MIEVSELKSVTVSLYGRRAGTLALTPEGLCAFQYDNDFIRNGYSLSPLKLPLGPQLFIARPHPFEGGFGVFDDSLPDGWGRLIQDRYLRANGIDPDTTSLLQRLSLMGKNGRGALEYTPATELPDEHGAEMTACQVDKLSAAAHEIAITEDASYENYAELYRYGGSSGGARPKAFIRADGTEWIIKFKAADDPDNTGQREYETSLLAKACGISMPQTRLFNDKYFAAERFDRLSSGKVYTVSAAGLLDADYHIPSLDYSGLLTLCRIITRNMKEVEQLFRRMVFNITIQNRDDHAKNFAFIMDERGEWRLSPAYDLLPSYGFGGYHTTTVNGSGRPERGDMLAVAEIAGITRNRADKIIDDIEEICAVEGVPK